MYKLAPSFSRHIHNNFVVHTVLTLIPKFMMIFAHNPSHSKKQGPRFRKTVEINHWWVQSYHVYIHMRIDYVYFIVYLYIHLEHPLSNRRAIFPATQYAFMDRCFHPASPICHSCILIIFPDLSSILSHKATSMALGLTEKCIQEKFGKPPSLVLYSRGTMVQPKVAGIMMQRGHLSFTATMGMDVAFIAPQKLPADRVL